MEWSELVTQAEEIAQENMLEIMMLEKWSELVTQAEEIPSTIKSL